MGTNLGETTWLNPLIQSGLVWAGVNTPQLLSNNEDGKLTALEVSQLPLNETELVVLSACQTGLGKVESGEGVYGLQRAFQVAGAKRLLMSLWEVNDQVTQEFMGIFYENLLKNQSPGEALKITRAEIRQKYPHPYYWAAFVLLER
jgi:CHAT domain-containing protein